MGEGWDEGAVFLMPQKMKHQRDKKQYQKNKENDPGNTGCGFSDTREAKNSGDNRNH